MSWTSKYWDILDQLYWAPKYLGLRSIPKSRWGDDPGTIQIPRGELQKGASIYTRVGDAHTNGQRARGQEEMLNDIFNLTFDIAPNEAISKLLHEAAGISDPGPFERFGREIAARYGWGSDNVTQQDAFFVSPRSILSVELKLGSKTWPGQVLKYLALTLLEERMSGRRVDVALLYITPHMSGDVMQQAGAGADGRLPADFLDQFDSKQLNSRLGKLLDDERAGFANLTFRLRLAHLSWNDLAEQCDMLAAKMDQERPGDEALIRLLGGFVEAVRTHKGTGC